MENTGCVAICLTVAHINITISYDFQTEVFVFSPMLNGTFGKSSIVLWQLNPNHTCSLKTESRKRGVISRIYWNIKETLITLTCHCWRISCALSNILHSSKLNQWLIWFPAFVFLILSHLFLLVFFPLLLILCWCCVCLCVRFFCQWLYFTSNYCNIHEVIEMILGFERHK